jgi:hypothetical protein
MNIQKATAFVKGNQRPLTVGAVVLVLLIIFYVLYRKGVFRNFFGGAGVKDNPNLTEAENADARRIAVALHQDLKGWSYSRNMSIWREFMGLRDEMVRTVYNIFGQLYYQSHKETLTDWVASEWQWQDPLGIASHGHVLQRLAALNLTPSAQKVVAPGRLPMPGADVTLRKDPIPLIDVVVERVPPGNDFVQMQVPYYMALPGTEIHGIGYVTKSINN